MAAKTREKIKPGKETESIGVAILNWLAREDPTEKAVFVYKSKGGVGGGLEKGLWKGKVTCINAEEGECSARWRNSKEGRRIEIRG